MNRIRYSLSLQIMFLILFSISACNCSANVVTDVARRTYNGVQYLVRSVHARLGTTRLVAGTTAVTLLAAMALYKRYFSTTDHNRMPLAPNSVPLKPNAIPPTPTIVGETHLPSVQALLRSKANCSSVDMIYRGVHLRIITGDITTQPVDVIVNAANEHLTGGGGVDGAIQQAAGPELADYCVKNFPVIAKAGGVPVRCPIGQVRVTPSFGLAKKGIRNIIHANGPRGSTPNREQLLASCYQNALIEANRLHASSIAFPAISVGIFGYPIGEATTCAVRAVVDSIMKIQPATLREIRFVLYDRDPNYQQLLNAYKEAIARHMPDVEYRLY